MAAADARSPGLRPTPAPIPVGPTSIAAILDPAVAGAPDEEALVDGLRRYTYRQIDHAVDAAAALLTQAGAAPGTRIACSAPNGCNIVIAFLAVQRIGAIWVGVNGVLPAAEKARLLRHAGAAIFLGDAGACAGIEEARAELPDLGRVLVMDSDGRWLDAGRGGAPFTRARVDPHAIAAINYTSGTTGEPKGVLHSQHGLLAPVASITAHGLAGAPLRRGVILPLSITNVMVVGPMLAFLNRTACVIGPGTRPADVLPWIDRERIEVFSSVPAIIHDLIHADRAPTSLKALLSGGAPLPLPVAARFARRFGFAITNTYGLTEAPTIVAESRGRADAPEGASGIALPHIRITIRDDAGDELPPGETGEICVQPVEEGAWRGVYARLLGYWRDAARTDAANAVPWLNTGDMGRLDADGWLYVTDRKSDMILRGGSNIYPQEIARVLEADRRVAACAIVGVPDDRLGERTAAFIQPAEGIAGDQALFDDLAGACRNALATYKCPDFWHALPVLPRNPGGKVVLAELRRIAAASKR